MVRKENKKECSERLRWEPEQRNVVETTAKLIYSRKDMNDKKELAITLIIWLMYFGDIQGFSPPSPGLNQMP